jgi:hypothetical protein
MKELILDIVLNRYFILIVGALALIAEIEFFVWRERRSKEKTRKAAWAWRLFYIPEGFVWLIVSFILLWQVDTMPIVIHTNFPKPVYRLSIEPPPVAKSRPPITTLDGWAWNAQTTVGVSIDGDTMLAFEHFNHRDSAPYSSSSNFWYYHAMLHH